MTITEWGHSKMFYVKRSKTDWFWSMNILKKKPNPENEHACLLLMLWYKYTRLLNLFPFTISANCKNWDSYIYVFTLYYYILLCVHCIYEQKTQIMICIYMYSCTCIILNTNVCLFHRFVFSFLDRKISFFFLLVDA